MFGFGTKKNRPRDLQRRYEAAMREARDIQRAGDIVAYAAKMAEAEALRAKLDALEADRT